MLPGNIRVLMLIYKFLPEIGGAEVQCLKLSRELRKRGIDVEVLTLTSSKNLPKKEIIDSVPVTRLPIFRPLELSILWCLFYLLKNQKKYDILHTHIHGPMSVPPMLIASIFRKPYIIKIANSGIRFDYKISEETRKWPLRKLLKQSFFKASKIISICNAVKSDIIATGFSERKIESLPNGVEYDYFHPATRELQKQRRAELRLPENAIIILRVGSLHSKKGLDLLLDTWKSITARYPNAFLLSVGGTNISTSLMEKIKPLEKTVRLDLNSPNGVRSYYQAADIFVLPSLAEGLSNALLEAQACGLSCIATKVGGNMDIIEHKVNGLLINPGDSSELTAAISLLLESPKYRNHLCRGTKNVKKKFNLKHIAARYNSLYSRLLLQQNKK